MSNTRSPLIIAVIFITFFHNVLSRHKIRHFKERFKRQQGAHLYLPGSFVTDNNDAEAGPWEEWSAPGPCSRTCGGGVSTQTRTCTPGYDCTGPSAKYFSCNTQDCPDIADYRAQQCADYNSILFEGTYYDWVPYTKGPNQCELNCMPRGERFYYRHADAVVDGTACNDEGYDVCVEGKCQPVGCDRMLGSNAREDQCRVCGGDGSTCNTFSNTIPMKDMTVGYNDILLIPAGATNIRIEELAPSNNYLAVRNTYGQYYLNGNWRIDFPKSTDFAGTRFKYERTPQEFDAPDIITSIGPTDEAIFIVLLYQGTDVPVSYSYSLPTMVPPPPNETYSWIYDEFTPCSVPCGRGFQYRHVSCAGRNSLEPADENLCDSQNRPDESRVCNEIDCKPEWVPQEWGDCSVPCGEEGGTQSRRVVCQKMLANGTQEVVDDGDCGGSWSKPTKERKCNANTICPKWHLDPWLPCDHLCGKGKQTRKIICYVEDENHRKKILPDSECQAVEKRPPKEQPCNLRPCEGVDWIVSEWSGCALCGLTQETRKVLCATADSEIQADELCDADRKPETSRECDSTPCPYLWYASQWSECSVTCGQGVQTRTIFCGISTPNGVEKADNSNCDPSKHFETVKNCTGEQEKCDGEWFSGPMGECSKPCGGGLRSKKVICIKDNVVVDPSACGSEKIVFAEENCNEQPCSEDTIMPTDVSQSVDESEPTKEASQKREATTPGTTITDNSESTDNTIFEITTNPSVTTPSMDEFEIVPDTNCDDGEWVDEEETMQGDDPFAYEDFMFGDQPLADDPLEGSGDTTYSTDTSYSTDSSTDTSYSTDSSTDTDTTEISEITVSAVLTTVTTPLEPETIIESDVNEATEHTSTIPPHVTTASGSTKILGSTTEFTGSTDTSISTTEFTGSTETTESTTEFTGSTETPESTTEFTGSTESPETTTEFTGSTESPETTTEFTGSTESPESTTEFTGSTEPSESTTEFTGSTEPSESTTEFTGSTEPSESTPEFTGSTEPSESTTEFTGSTKPSESTTEFTGSTEPFESTTEFTGSTEPSESTTEFTGSTEPSESTTEFTGSTETPESTTEFTGSTESPETTIEFTGSTELSESTTEFTGSTETPGSTTEFTGSTEPSVSTTEFTGSTETPGSTTEFTGSTEAAGSTTEFTGSTEPSESTTEFTGSTETPGSTTEFTGSTDATQSTTEFTGSTEISESTTEFTGSTETPGSTTEFTGSTEASESTTEFTGSTETSGSTTEFTGSTETPGSTTEFTGSTETPESTTEFTGSTEPSESTTEFTGSTETPGSTTEFTGSTESSASTTEFTGSTETSGSTTEITGSTESSASTTEFTGSTETPGSTTEFTGSTEPSISTTEFTGSTEIPESTTEFTGSTELSVSTTESTGSTDSSGSTTEFTGSTETPGSTTEFTGSTESSISTTEFTGSTELSASTTEFTGSTESPESTTEFTGSTELSSSTIESTGSTESTASTTEFTGSTETPESTTEFTGSTELSSSTTESTGSTEPSISTTEITGSTEASESTTEFTGSTESSISTTEFTGSTETPESTTEFTGSTEASSSTSEFTGSTETSESTTEFTGSTESSVSTTEFTGSTESSISTSEYTGSTESSVSTTEFTGSTETSESTTEFTGSTETSESTTEFTGSTESSTEFTGSTESTSILDIFTKKPRMCKRRKIKQCKKSQFGCCWDNITPAQGPFDKGCPMPETCKESKFGCCEDGVSPALGPKDAGCPPSYCKETLFGCCPDNKTPSQGNDYEGCPPACLSSRYGCCNDNITEAAGSKHKGCPEDTTTPLLTTETTEITSESTTESSISTETGESSSTTTEISTETTIALDCNETPYRCCPDGKTIATGPGFRGCGLPCSESIFGCCQDTKTPAHGPSGEGCCLSSQFGCCPDDITEAEGLNLAGCHCSKSPYGCCPDNKTSAQGYEKEGCGCKYTPNGCCPDGVTPAIGPNYEGCLCHTFQFGCCEDGITTAEGPSGQGCGCRNAEFGCCSDDKTPASGPNLEGCTCENTKFGCCIDGVTEAKGEDFKGCSDIPENLQAGCSLEKERGMCRNYTVKWYFDLDYGGCSRFWYGGCDGNGNRFKSKEDCDETCVEPKGTDRCKLPKISGPCEDYFPMWYYDQQIKTCTQFIYGGCLGNNNRFETREECLDLCGQSTEQDPCEQPKEQGPCQGRYQRFYYDKNLAVCQEFNYGGCQGNANNFATIEACKQQCAPTGQRKDLCSLPKSGGNCTDVLANWYYDTSRKDCAPFYYSGCYGNLNNFETKEACQIDCPPDVEKDTCVLPADSGNCDKYVERWYYDTKSKYCRPFYYGGCGGNDNNFLTEQQCQGRCEGQLTTTTPAPTPEQTRGPEVHQPGTDTCVLPVEAGDCDNYVERWYFDSKLKYCRPFYYGGCGGNDNNFLTEEQCQGKCEGKLTTTTTPIPLVLTPEPTREPEPFDTGMCFLPSETGPCRASLRKYFYDSQDGICKDFIYGGCSGNGNNFNSIDDCIQHCGDSQDRCTLPPVRGPCSGNYLQYYYDQTTDSCQEFSFGGCGGNSNRFEDKQSCEQDCKRAPPQPTYTQAPTVATEISMCYQQPDPGNCTDRFTAFYYDGRSCLPFIYTGCGGNNNRFNSEEQCQRQCGSFRNQDVCSMDRDPGPCRGYYVKYYFDKYTGRCAQFAYGGCNGNGNRFSSEQECSQLCITHEEKKPNITANVLCRLPVDRGYCGDNNHKRWYYDDYKGDCIAFIYSGCGGNFNNFKSYPYCLDYCKELLLNPEAQPLITTDLPPHPCQEAFDECTTLRCAYGVEPFVDENECNRCRCHDPCTDVECYPDEQCAIDINRNKSSPQDADFIAVCRKQIKPGTCPQLDISDNRCEEECRSDADCALQMKCCSTGCGTSCVDPPGQLVTQYEPTFTEGPIEPDFQPPYVDPVEYKPEVAASIGDQAILRCSVSGNPNPKIRWSKDNIEIDGTQPRYRIKLDQSLQIVTLHKTDSGIYLCTASNGVGTPITNQVKLEVIDSEPRPAVMLSDPEDEQPLVVSLNAPATLNCLVLGYPFPAVTWWKDDSLIPFKNSEYEIRKDYSLLIHSVQLDNLGIYTCQAYNGYGKAASWSVTVKAKGPIKFADPEDQKYNKWIVNDEYVTTARTTTSTTTTTTTALPITRRKPTTTRSPPFIPFPSYTEPSNEIIPNTLPDAQGGLYPPSISVPVRTVITINDQRYPTGSDIEIPCDISGYPTPQVQWYKDGIELYETDRIRIIESGRLNIITIESVTKADSGLYQCEATNNYSRDSSSLEIFIEGIYIHPTCTDNQFFANCSLVVKAKYCLHKYYSKFCCRSCTEAGLLPADGSYLRKRKRHSSFENNLV